MPQSYHSNAVTNVHIRCDIRKSNQTNAILAAQYGTSSNTISKWKNRNSMDISWNSLSFTTQTEDMDLSSKNSKSKHPSSPVRSGCSLNPNYL